MPDMIFTLLTLISSIAILLFSSDRFINGSAASAKHLGVTPAMIGLTIVALGTSAPEIMVSAGAAFDGEAALGIGNAVGSNIANIALVLGATALFTAIPLREHTLRLEIGLLLLVTIAAIACLWDLRLTRSEGLLLLLGSISLPLLLIYQARSGTESSSGSSIELSPSAAVLNLLGGLLALLLSAKLLVWAATDLATQLGVSSLMIGLTIVALGTSLPELAASLASAIKGHHGIALGNIIGSNILNLLAVMSLPGIIAPDSAFDSQLLWRDMSIMTGLTLLLAALTLRPSQAIGRGTGLLLLGCYIGYYLLLFHSHSTTL